jgi:serine/threonine protein kinase
VKRGEIPAFWTHRNIANMMIGLILGMKYLHSRNIIHGDLKPGTLLIDENDRLRIANFGMAKLEDYCIGTEQREKHSSSMYIPYGMLNKEPATKKADVFAFGMILYEVLVRQSIVPKDENAEKHQQNKFVLPTIPNDIHRIVADVIQRCWSTDAEARPTFDEIFSSFKNNRFPFFRDVDPLECERFIAEVTRRVSQGV